MSCQCSVLSVLRNDLGKLDKMERLLQKLLAHNLLDIQKRLMGLSLCTALTVHPDNLNNLMQHEKELDKDVNYRISDMREQCRAKRVRLKKRIDNLEVEDKRWHEQERLRLEKERRQK